MAQINIPSTVLWGDAATSINQMFAEMYLPRFGIYDYSDNGTVITPINIAAPDTWYNLTNDTLGAFTNTSFKLNGIDNIWDATTQSFDFSGLKNGDSVDIRLDVTVVSTTANQDFDVDLFVADGEVGEYQLPFIVEQTFKSAGSHRLLRYNGLYIGGDSTRLNQARFKVKSSSAGSATVNGWYCKVQKRIP